MLKSLLIANRGEIACGIIRTAPDAAMFAKLGLKPLQSEELMGTLA